VADHRLFTLRTSIGVGVGVCWLALACAFMPQDAPAAGNGEGTLPVTHIVTIDGMHFDPETLTVKTGDHVMWVNKDMVPHTATAVSKIFDSQGIAADASWTYIVNKPGSYPYACEFHPSMQGTLIVQ
jgi:plastocyanin